MAEHCDSGIPWAESLSGARPAQDAPSIVRAPTGVTAFIGRTVKGPLGRAVRVSSFAEFERTFGGLWQPSTLSYALGQFFENGGRQALVVRVANGATAPTLTLPGARGALGLVGVHPGSREYLRAAVDYDGSGGAEPDRFNLVLQRLRLPATELIEDQEIHRRVCIEPGSARNVRQLLLESQIMRVAGDLPPDRPDPTCGVDANRAAAYVSAQPGSDGSCLSDYDIIGSPESGTGLAALAAGEPFDLLCIPPLGRERDLGLATLLVAARLCRERHALLVVDPPRAWATAEQAVAAMDGWPFRSEDAVMFFPRVRALDPLRNRVETFGSAAAAAGMLARGDAAAPVWSPAEGEELILRPGLRLAADSDAAARTRLAQAGINTLAAVRSCGPVRWDPCTLAGAQGSLAARHLTIRRLELFILASIESGLRWLRDAPSEPRVWERAQAQVERFLDALCRDGAFAGSRAEESYFVVCDGRVNHGEGLREAAERLRITQSASRDRSAEGRIRLLFGIAPARPADFHAWLLSFGAGMSRARSVAVNALAAGAHTAA